MSSTDQKSVICQVCNSRRSNLYCNHCKVQYCSGCDSLVHGEFLKKKHQQFIKIIAMQNIGLDQFDQNYTYSELLLSNNNTSLTNSAIYYGRSVGTKIYSTGYHDIVLKIDRYDHTQNANLQIYLGVMGLHNRENFLKTGALNDSISFHTFQTRINQTKRVLKSQKVNFVSNNVNYGEKYGKPFKEGDNVHIFLDMDKKEVSFGTNQDIFGLATNNLPGQVVFFCCLQGNTCEQTTIISFIQD
ncbi:zinc finger protein constans-like [Anaeramoeba flamelloides]|uniref:Zinc finger protein constans-like n=1 Tax=Anaeramoeba flamelloides TaxID=1746091 RepID=A0AAV7Y6L8_9EUKA|nr:zinc finger protein constans-like [Anaeramoeba flamelloides]